MIERFRSASPRRQILVAAAVIVAVSIGMAAIWFFLLRPAYEPLFSRLRTADAATIVADLDRRKIAYRLADGGATIMVPADKVDSTRLAVMSEDLPLKGAVGFELFNQSDLGLTDFAQKINYQRALQGELARTIMTLDGVDSARVHLSLGEDRLFREDRISPKASVTIRMMENGILPTSAAEGIQRLVAAAVPQLEAQNVVILDEAGAAIHTPAPNSRVIGQSLSAASMEKQAIEQYYRARIQRGIEQLEPAGGILVTVEAATAPREAGDDFSGWTPMSRAFGLRVALATDDPPTDSLRDQLQDGARAAIGFDPALGDSIVFVRANDVARPPVDTTAYRDAARHRIDTAAPSPSTKGTIGYGSVLLVVGAVAGIVLLLRRRKQTAALGPEERSAFAARLKSALAQEDDHAPVST